MFSYALCSSIGGSIQRSSSSHIRVSTWSTSWGAGFQWFPPILAVPRPPKIYLFCICIPHLPSRPSTISWIAAWTGPWNREATKIATSGHYEHSNVLKRIFRYHLFNLIYARHLQNLRTFLKAHLDKARGKPSPSYIKPTSLLGRRESVNGGSGEDSKLESPL